MAIAVANRAYCVVEREPWSLAAIDVGSIESIRGVGYLDSCAQFYRPRLGATVFRTGGLLQKGARLGARFNSSRSNPKHAGYKTGDGVMGDKIIPPRGDL